MTGYANESIHALSGAYVVDALDEHERAEFEAHLTHCRDCQAEVASLREATALMAEEAALTPPASLRENVLAGITTLRPLPPVVPSSAGQRPAPEPDTNVVPLRRRPGQLRMLLVAAAAAVVTAVGVGVVSYPWGEQTATLSETDRVLAASDAERVSLDFPDGSSATVVRSVKERRAVLVTRDMAAPPSGRVYELWLQDDKGAMVPAGLMRSRGDHKVLLEGDATRYVGVGITVEPEGGSPEPTSKPIAVFELGKADA